MHLLIKNPRELLGDGFLEHTIPEKPGSRLHQRYRLTEAGKAQLAPITGDRKTP